MTKIKKPSIKTKAIPTPSRPVAAPEMPKKKGKSSKDIPAVPFSGNADALKAVKREDKKTVGKRGPDRKPRKERKDKGTKKATPADEQKKEVRAVEHQVEGEQKKASAEGPDLALAPNVRAQLLSRAIVGTVDAVICRWLPPRMSAAEKAILVDVWAPVLEMYQDDIGYPWGPALIATGLVFLPRLVVALNSWRK